MEYSRNVSRPPSKVVWFALATAWLGALASLAAKLPAQAVGTGTSKPRLELADTARRAAAVSAPASTPRPSAPSVAPAGMVVAAPAVKPPRAPETATQFRADFVRNQTMLGVAVYAPAFATTVAHDGLAWAASYLLVAGGSFVAAAEISRDLKVTDPMQRLATGAPIRSAIAGSILASALDGDRRVTAGAVLFSSLGGTAAGLWLGRNMTDGEAAATLYGSDILGLATYAAMTAAGVNGAGSPNKTRAGLTLAGMIAGAPLGQAYAALAPYHVSVGDLTAMSASAGVGMLAGLTVIANGERTDRQVSAALAIGGAAGLLVGDRLLVRRYDHTLSEGRLIVAGGLAGGLTGAGVALLTGGQQARVNAYAATLTTVGAAGGIILAQRYLLPKADGALRLGGLKLNPLGVVAAASGMRGAYTLGSLTF